MSELNGSNITMWLPWLTDLVSLRAYAIVRGINHPTGHQEWEMPIPRCDVIREGTQTGVAGVVRRLEHDPTPSCVADEVVTGRCDGTITILNKCVPCVVGENGVLQKRPHVRFTRMPWSRPMARLAMESGLVLFAPKPSRK
jgi:hypothetical protein